MADNTLVAAKLYRVRPQGLRGNNDYPAAFLVKGYSASIQVSGSVTKPAALANTVPIAAAITANGIYTIAVLPEYIYITGTFTGIELINYVTEEDLGALS